MKYFERFKLSIKLSIRAERKINPNNEYRPVLTSKMRNPDKVKIISEIMRPLPMSTLVYFFRIMAITSVPPLDAPILNKIAEPKAGSKIAKTNSSRGSLVSGWLIG